MRTHLASTNIIVGESMFPYSASTAHESAVCSSVRSRPFCTSSMMRGPPGCTAQKSTIEQASKTTRRTNRRKYGSALRKRSRVRTSRGCRIRFFVFHGALIPSSRPSECSARRKDEHPCHDGERHAVECTRRFVSHSTKPQTLSRHKMRPQKARRQISIRT